MGVPADHYGSSDSPQITLDGIIFGLQRFGGISNFFSRLVDATSAVRICAGTELILPKTLRSKLMPGTANVSVRREVMPTAFARYLPVPNAPRRGKFHTSYYRVPLTTVDTYITSVYDFTYERYFKGWPRRIHHYQKWASIAAADMAICISEATRADLLSHFPKVDPARTCVVPLAVDHQQFFPDPDPTILEPYILFVGQRTGYKRFDLAVAAVKRLPDLFLAVAGPPLTKAEKSHLESALPGRWVEHAAVSPQRLRQLYSSAFAFLFPSDYEGFGLPILEAMACGCPVVAAHRSSFPEVAGTAALLAEDQEPDTYAMLLRDLGDATRRTQLVADGRNRAGAFTWEKVFTEIWTFYR